MRTYRGAPFFALLLFVSTLTAQPAPPVPKPETTPPAAPAPRLTVQAVRAVHAPAIDGDLNDEVWAQAPEITGFTQHDPDDGKPATQKTIVKVAYDEQALYVAARLEDTKPVTTLLGRRDNELASDWFRIYVDGQHDRLSGASFWVNPSNVQIDMVLYNDTYNDWSWDAVWQSAAKIVPGGWIAEVRIPYSQLRFNDAATQTWGVNFMRTISKNNEVDRLVNTPKGENGTVSRFADLTGIEGIHPARAFEIVPYGVTRSDLTSRIDAGDPFTRRRDARIDGGVDVKYGLTSNLTLTGTVNPDFGQVEVDPAVVNLGTFETFFPEKRPFFTEGVQMFRFGQGPANSRWNFNFFGPQWFYSRRIGRSPQGTGNVSADYVEAPNETTILGAGKITGKFGKGWSVGVLDAVTDKETARVSLSDLRDRTTVEPMTNYFVGRLAKEYGNSRIGFLFTGVNRKVPEELSYLRSSAYVAGVDGYTQFHKKDWLLEWMVGGSKVTGSEEAIASTQQSSAHYYQRPDADYVHFDPTRRSLSGWGGRAMLGKQTGHWKPNVQVQAYSPGFEANDVGFMPRADEIVTHAVMMYDNQELKSKYLRNANIWVGKFQNWNYGGDLLANGVFGNWNVEAKNYWYGFGWFGKAGDTMDDRATRGGPLAQRPGNWDLGAGIGSDSRKKLSFELSQGNFSAKDGAYYRSVNLYLNYRPTSNVRLSISPSYSRSHDRQQYVQQNTNPGAREGFNNRDYVFGQLEQHQFDMGTRVEWTASARLSMQLYMQPFIGTGAYHDYTRLSAAGSGIYSPYDPSLVDNPDFNFRSLRGSAVVRWEFRPGSALYVVWNENRSDTMGSGDFRLRRDLSSLRNALSRDVFLLKVSYWLPM
jgi:hypothetical protein